MKKEYKEDASKKERRARRYDQFLKENAQHMKLLRMLNSGNEDGNPAAGELNSDDNDDGGGLGGLGLDEDDDLGDGGGKDVDDMTYEEAMQELIALTNDLGGAGRKKKKKRTSSQSSSEEDDDDDD